MEVKPNLLTRPIIQNFGDATDKLTLNCCSDKKKVLRSDANTARWL